MEISVSNFFYTLLIEIRDNLSLSNAGSRSIIELSRSGMVLEVVHSGGQCLFGLRAPILLFSSNIDNLLSEDRLFENRLKIDIEL